MEKFRSSQEEILLKKRALSINSAEKILGGRSLITLSVKGQIQIDI